MNAEEKAELDALCQRIVEEKDHSKFLDLVMQLNQLLERKERRLEPPPERSSP